MKNIYLIGLGAIGGGYAAMAKDRRNFDVKVIVNDERKQRYSNDGFVINDKKYDFEYVSEPYEKVDLLFIAVKANQLEEAIAQAKPFVSDETIIISLLNGISSERIIAEKVGKGKILPGFTVGTDGQRDGNQIKFSVGGKIVFGHASSWDQAFAEKAEAILNDAGMPFEKVDNIDFRQWWKMMVNTGTNQTQGLLDVNYGAFKNEHVAAIARGAMQECVAIANKLDIPLSEKNIDEVFQLVASFKPENITSLMQDLKAGRETEIDIFAGELCRLGEKLGVKTPVNRMLLNAIRWKELRVAG